MPTSGFHFPALTEPYEGALRECVNWITPRYDLLAIFASGTIVRGEGDPRSDVDMFVLHRAPFRERIQKRFQGVPFEIFVNPLSRLEAYFDEERRDRRPITAHMLATGFIVHDPEGTGHGLQVRCRKMLLNPPKLQIDDKDATWRNYIAASTLEDAVDMADRDPEEGAFLLGAAVRAIAEARIAAEPGWIPRPKDLLQRLREIDPEAASLAIRASNAATLADRFEAARTLCVRVTGHEGFFEWQSDRQSTES